MREREFLRLRITHTCVILSGMSKAAREPDTADLDANTARAKTLARVFAWCPKCTGDLVQGRCLPCDEEEARNVRVELEASIRKSQNRAAPNRCATCEGSGAVPGFSGLTACYGGCNGTGLR